MHSQTGSGEKEGEEKFDCMKLKKKTQTEIRIGKDDIKEATLALLC